MIPSTPSLRGRRRTFPSSARGMYDTLYAVPEGTATDFPFLRNREDWRVCQVLRHLANREIPPEVGNKANFSWDYYPGSPPKLGEMDRGVHVPGALGIGQSVPPSASLRCMNSARCATYLWYVARPCIPPHQCGGSMLRCLEAWPRECPRWWHSRKASSWGNPLGVPIT